ncbi:hypothetical protein [Sorangium sp. So ce693]|uniref:hypothetical protein n=1 Tax=Sorangium sp. So ce693 TaxID=3133318 RepID=UPI003F612291
MVESSERQDQVSDHLEAFARFCVIFWAKRGELYGEPPQARTRNDALSSAEQQELGAYLRNLAARAVACAAQRDQGADPAEVFSVLATVLVDGWLHHPGKDGYLTKRQHPLARLMDDYRRFGEEALERWVARLPRSRPAPPPEPPPPPPRPVDPHYRALGQRFGAVYGGEVDAAAGAAVEPPEGEVDAANGSAAEELLDGELGAADGGAAEELLDGEVGAADGGAAEELLDGELGAADGGAAEELLDGELGAADGGAAEELLDGELGAADGSAAEELLDGEPEPACTRRRGGRVWGIRLVQVRWSSSGASAGPPAAVEPCEPDPGDTPEHSAARARLAKRLAARLLPPWARRPRGT